MIANDPEGEWINFIVGGIKASIENVVIQQAEIALGLRDEFSWGELAVDAAIGTVTSGASTVKNAGRIAEIGMRAANKADDVADASRLANKADDAADIAQAGARRTDDGLDTAKMADDLKEGDGPIHHCCTNKNEVAAVRGGPWTPKFQEMFDKAGMDMDDVLNRVRVPGHKGPHPQEYHE